MLKEPAGLNYFRFHEEEYAILCMLDGQLFANGAMLPDGGRIVAIESELGAGDQTVIETVKYNFVFLK